MSTVLATVYRPANYQESSDCKLMIQLILQFLLVVGGILILAPAIGLLFDRVVDTAPWGFFASLFLGTIVAVAYVVRTIQGRYTLLAPPPPDDEGD